MCLDLCWSRTASPSKMERASLRPAISGGAFFCMFWWRTPVIPATNPISCFNVFTGKLYLSHNLTLSRPSALVLKGYSEVIETSNGTLMFMKNVKERLLINAIATSVFYVFPKNSHNAQTFIIVKLPFIKRPLQYISDYMVSIKVTTPPPKLAYS